ncbi:tetratricopeptide repeat protein [Streptomyces roseirectus]|uniref:Tetratricopeptide repeat protein n=1 Tax=Streptomyces roseirectus TaxID=2768066 RepID=A0A7H0IDK0_9ACTN|nr:tetratricopeptide repeat protein [Streptomyces roseirectus]QNP70866.1 tetratricopeptide repeat protein [Streptomyces roseirectus]
MPRPSREPQRAPAVTAPAPIDVRVTAHTGATIGGVPVTVPDGQEIQHAVLAHLRRTALATGHAVLATVHDERSGYIVPIQVHPDGSSTLTAEPVPITGTSADTATPRAGAPTPGTHAAPPQQTGAGTRTDAYADETPTAAPGTVAPPTGVFGPPPVMEAAEERAGLDEVPPDRGEEAPGRGQVTPGFDDAAGLSVGAPVIDAAAAGLSEGTPRIDDTAAGPGEGVPGRVEGTPGFDGGSAGPGASAPGFDEMPPGRREAASWPGDETAGQADGALLDAEPSSPSPSRDAFAPEARRPSVPPAPPGAPQPLAPPASLDTPPRPVPLVDPETVVAAREPAPKHTPARGFDAVAEAVLGDDPRETDGAEPGPFAAPVARINEAVRAGQIDVAVALAEQTVQEASTTLGADHPEVLRLRELAAYIAYLAGDPVRAFHVSLDVAWTHRRTGDPESAYDNVQSAATAWRAVREPVQGLNLGNELLGLWAALAAEGGPAAEDPGPLESARSRMLRLAERAAARQGS